MKKHGISLMDDYGRLGLLAPPQIANDTAKPSGPTPVSSSEPVSKASQREDLDPPELLQLVEFPHPHFPGRTQTLTLERYERDVKEDDREFKDSAIVVRRIVDTKGKTTNFQIEIQSKGLQKVLKHVSKDSNYNDLNITTDPVIISRPFHCLFFLREPLQERADSPKTNARVKEEINLLLDFVRSHECLGPVISKYNEQVPNKKITFDILWTLFPPYEPVYITGTEFDECFLVQKCYNAISFSEGRSLAFDLLYSCHDGKKFGIRESNLSIPKFLGTVDITTNSMALIPLRFLEETRQDRIRREFIERAKIYLELQKATFTMKQHKGSLWILTGAFLELALEVENKNRYVESNGRVVIDATAARETLPTAVGDGFIASSLKELMGKQLAKLEKKYETDESKLKTPVNADAEIIDSLSDSSGTEADISDDAVSVSSDDSIGGHFTVPRPPRSTKPPPIRYPGPPGPPPPPGPHSIVPKTIHFAVDQDEEKEEERSDLEYLICQSSVVAFMLDRKAWVKVLVEDLCDIDWYPDPWASLQLEVETKALIKTLVEGSTPTEDVFAGWDDIVEGKGKGLIFLLHGLPGLGKTFTAETIAEQTRRPLYQVSTGELSTNVNHLEQQLRQIFKLGWRWGAIVLIDEADVIMAERDLSDLARSAIVAVFLRLVEYYRGLLFLTTNKIENFDPAFYNRIHAIIEYPPLGKEARTNIWKNLLGKRKRGGVKLDKSWNDEESKIYNILGELEMNGRDIRNLIRAAYGVSHSKNVPLGVRHIIRVLTRICRVSNGEEIAKRLEFAAAKTNTFNEEAERLENNIASDSDDVNESLGE